MVAGVAVALVLRPMRNAVRAGRAGQRPPTSQFATDITELASHMQEVRVFNVEHECCGGSPGASTMPRRPNDGHVSSGS